MISDPGVGHCPGEQLPFSLPFPHLLLHNPLCFALIVGAMDLCRVSFLVLVVLVKLVSLTAIASNK